MSYKFVTALVLASVLLLSVLVVMPSAEAVKKTKARSDADKRTLRNKICGDKLCSQVVMEKMKEGNVMKGLKTKNNTDCVNPPNGPKIC